MTTNAPSKPADTSDIIVSRAAYEQIGPAVVKAAIRDRRKDKWLKDTVTTKHRKDGRQIRESADGYKAAFILWYDTDDAAWRVALTSELGNWRDGQQAAKA